MDYFSMSEDNALKHLSVDKRKGLNDKQIEFNRTIKNIMELIRIF